MSINTRESNTQEVVLVAMDQILVVDADSHIVIETVEIPSFTWAVAAAPSGEQVYVNSVDESTNFDGLFVIIDTSTWEAVAQISLSGTAWSDIAITPDGSTAYVSSYYDGKVYVIDLERQVVSKTIDLGAYIGPLALAVSSTGDRVWVADSFGLLYEIDTSNNVTNSDAVSIQKNVVGLAISPDDATLCATSSSAGVTLIDVETGIVRFVDGFEGTSSSVVFSTASLAYFPDDSGALWSLDVTSAVPTVLVDIDGGASGIALSPDGSVIATTGNETTWVDLSSVSASSSDISGHSLTYATVPVLAATTAERPLRARLQRAASFRAERFHEMRQRLEALRRG
jgi:YVTN family beta-propeller protein